MSQDTRSTNSGMLAVVVIVGVIAIALLTYVVASGGLGGNDNSNQSPNLIPTVEVQGGS